MSWGVLEPSWERFGAVLGAFVRLGSVLGPCLFFGVDFGVILDVILDHFGVDFGSNFRPFGGDENDDDDDDDDDDVHVRRRENLNLTTYVSLFQTRSPELRAVTLAEGLYNITSVTRTHMVANSKSVFRCFATRKLRVNITSVGGLSCAHSVCV